MPGGKRRHIGHLDTHALEAEAARMGKQLHPRVEPKTETEPGRLVWVLDVGPDMELTADYRSAV